MSGVLGLDTRLFVLLNQQWTSPFLDVVMPILTNFDYWRYPLILLILAVFWRGSTETRIGFLFTILALIVADQVSSSWLKQLFERVRPFHVIEGTRQLVDAHNYSFPSSHAANTFAAGVFIALRFPKLRWLLALPVLVSYSRVYVGVHYPLDVVGGAAIGGAIGAGFAGVERVARMRLASLFRRKRAEPEPEGDREEEGV